MTTESSNLKLSSDNIDDLQTEAEQLFSQMKYLQSAKITSQIAAACESKEYTAEVVAKFNQVCVSDLIAKSKFSAAVLVLKEVLSIVQNSLLKEGEETIDPENLVEYQNLKRLTLNNLGCALKKSGQIDEAQFYFEQITNQDPLYELNLCAVQNQKGNHRQALLHAQQAANLLEAEVKDLRAQLEKGNLEDSNDKDFFLERTSLLAIAYYNQGCELEHLENLMRATQAFSRAVSLQSSKHANQQLLTQFKLSLKQARFKLRQQMVSGNLGQTQMMRDTTTSVPIYQYNNKSISLDKRPYSAINNQLISPYRFQSAGAKKQLPKIAKVQHSSIYSSGKKQNQAMRMSIHSNMSHNSHQSDLSEQQQAIVDQMISRPSHQDQRLLRGKKQANQSGSNSNSLRQKQTGLRVSQPDLGTGLGFSHSRSNSASQPKKDPYNISANKKNSNSQQSLPPISQSKPKLQTETQKALGGYGAKNQAYQNSQSGSKITKPPISYTQSYPNKLNDNAKALKALKDLGLAKGSVQQQQKALDSIMKIQRWIRVRIIRKNFLKVIRNHVRDVQNKNANSKTKASANLAQKKRNMLNVVNSFDRFGSGPDVAKKQKCARIIQSWFRRRRFRKLVHAMIVRRKVQLGYYSKSKLDEIEYKTLRRLQDLDKKFRNNQVEMKKQELKRNKAIKLIQSLFRRRRVRKVVASVAKVIRDQAKQGQVASQVKSNMREAFIKKVLQKAKEIRDAEIRNEIIHRENLKNSVRVLQAWIRRRRFRKAVHAMIIFRKVSTGRIPVTQLKKLDAATYNTVLNANKMRKLQEKQQKQDQVKEKAVRMIQGMFRRRRFRNLVNIIISIQKDARQNLRTKKNTSFVALEKERNATLQAAFLKHKAQVAKNAAFQVRKRKAIKLIQSFVRRRRFRKLIEARLLLHKFQQGKVKASALRKIDPKIREAILNADRKTYVDQQRLARSIRIIQSFVRRRKFRQLVYWMVQVRKLSNQNSQTKNKKLTDRQINQLAEKANQMRKKHNLEQLQQRKKEKIAKKVIVSFVRRWRFRRAVQALIAKKKVKKQASKPLTKVQQMQLKKAAEIHKERDQIAQQQRQKEICVRMIQRFIRVRRFRKAVEAIVEIGRRYRKAHIAHEVMFKQKVWEARALQKQWDYERMVQRRKEKRAIALIQSFVRRRNFRKIVEAILLQIRISKGKATAKQMKSANKSPLVKKQLNEWNTVVRQAQSQNKKLLKATRLIQSWFRRRKFRKLVDAMIELRKGTGKKNQRANKAPISIQQANQLRIQMNRKEIAEKKQMIKAVKIVQRWFRRRRFRQLVFAMVVKSQVQKKKLSGAALEKFSKQTLDRLNRADAYQKQIQIFNRKEEKAIRLVQRWYRMRRFRKAVLAVIEAGRQLQSNWANKRHYLSSQEKALFDERIVLKAEFIRKKTLKNEIEHKQRMKRATKFLQSWWRRRKFRKTVEQVIAKKRKTKTIANNSKVAQNKKPSTQKSSLLDQSPNKQAFVSRNFVSPQKTKNLTETISRKPAEQTLVIGTPTTEVQSSQKIVIDYWQDGMQVVFQQAFTKKKPLVMVNLVINSHTVDRKVIPIDLYKCALDAGDYDLNHFCDQWLMPCILIKEKNGKYSIDILDELVAEFQHKSNTLNDLDQQRLNTASSFGRGSEQTEGTLKLLSKKLTGMMPLVKRNAYLNGKDYIVQAICDFDMQVIKLTAEREDAYLYLNVQMTHLSSPVTSDQLPNICAYATDLTHQLTIVRDELQLRKAIPCLHDDEVLFRTSATIKERFYLISIGHQNKNLIIEALDKAREIRLQLKIGKYQESTQFNQDEAQKLVAKLDTKTTNGETVLVLK